MLQDCSAGWLVICTRASVPGVGLFFQMWTQLARNRWKRTSVAQFSSGFAICMQKAMVAADYICTIFLKFGNYLSANVFDNTMNGMRIFHVIFAVGGS